METTSRKYYEDKLREFHQYRRGRTLQQFCKDEGIDYKWMQRVKSQFSARGTDEPEAKSAELPPLIQLHYKDDEVLDDTNKPCKPEAIRTCGWKVGNVTLTDPSGNEMTISSGSAGALGNLLTKLASCHD